MGEETFELYVHKTLINDFSELEGIFATFKERKNKIKTEKTVCYFCFSEKSKPNAVVKISINNQVESRKIDSFTLYVLRELLPRSLEVNLLKSEFMPDVKVEVEFRDELNLSELCEITEEDINLAMTLQRVLNPELFVESSAERRVETIPPPVVKPKPKVETPVSRDFNVIPAIVIGVLVGAAVAAALFFTAPVSLSAIALVGIGLGVACLVSTIGLAIHKAYNKHQMKKAEKENNTNIKRIESRKNTTPRQIKARLSSSSSENLLSDTQSSGEKETLRKSHPLEREGRLFALHGFHQDPKHKIRRKNKEAKTSEEASISSPRPGYVPPKDKGEA